MDGAGRWGTVGSTYPIVASRATHYKMAARILAFFLGGGSGMAGREERDDTRLENDVHRLWIIDLFAKPVNDL